MLNAERLRPYVAAAADFLASSEVSFATGADWIVDGGISARLACPVADRRRPRSASLRLRGIGMGSNIETIHSRSFPENFAHEEGTAS